MKIDEQNKRKFGLATVLLQDGTQLVENVRHLNLLAVETTDEKLRTDLQRDANDILNIAQTSLRVSIDLLADLADDIRPPNLEVKLAKADEIEVIDTIADFPVSSEATKVRNNHTTKSKADERRCHNPECHKRLPASADARTRYCSPKCKFRTYYLKEHPSDVVTSVQ